MYGEFQEVFVSELRDIYNAENRIIQELPILAKAAHSKDLKDAFRNHLEETKEQVDRLEKIFQILNIEPAGKTCAAAVGLIQECNEVIDAYASSAVRDAALIAKAQRVEYYEIAVYSSLITFAKLLELSHIADFLEKTLKEERNAEQALKKIAEGSFFTKSVNKEAASEDAKDVHLTKRAGGHPLKKEVESEDVKDVHPIKRREAHPFKKEVVLGNAKNAPLIKKEAGYPLKKGAALEEAKAPSLTKRGASHSLKEEMHFKQAGKNSRKMGKS